MPDLANSLPKKKHSALARLSGVFTIIGALGVGLIGWFALHTIAQNMRMNPETEAQMSRFAVSLIDARSWLPFITMLFMGSGAVLVFFPRTSPAAWLLFVVSILGIVALFAVVLYCFISFIGPMYEYQPL